MKKRIRLKIDLFSYSIERGLSFAVYVYSPRITFSFERCIQHPASSLACTYLPPSPFACIHIDLSIFKRVNSKRKKEEMKLNECMTIVDQYFLSLSRSLCRSSTMAKEREREEKQQEAIRPDGQVIHLSRKLSLLSLVS